MLLLLLPRPLLVTLRLRRATFPLLSTWSPSLSEDTWVRPEALLPEEVAERAVEELEPLSLSRTERTTLPVEPLPSVDELELLLVLRRLTLELLPEVEPLPLLFVVLRLTVEDVPELFLFVRFTWELLDLELFVVVLFTWELLEFELFVRLT